MPDALNEGLQTKDMQPRFEKHLNLQKASITEVGEQELTDQLSNNYISLNKDPEDRALFSKVYKDITGIILLNMQAIDRKSEIAAQTAKEGL